MSWDKAAYSGASLSTAQAQNLWHHRSRSMAYYDPGDRTWVSTDPSLPFIKVLASTQERAEHQINLLKAAVALGLGKNSRLRIEPAV